MNVIKRLILFLMILSVPVILFLNTWQNFRYRSLYSEVLKLEKQQETWLENNKSLIVGIEIFKSPKRIERIAIKDLKLYLARPSEVLKIVGRKNLR